ncbi:MAG TPA: hypothetical protein VLH19_00300 [Patescibacteria group bacterium]|nr:hypothetical protein [Patescibacteria group bacterium]
MADKVEKALILTSIAGGALESIVFWQLLKYAFALTPDLQINGAQIAATIIGGLIFYIGQAASEGSHGFGMEFSTGFFLGSSIQISHDIGVVSAAFPYLLTLITGYGPFKRFTGSSDFLNKETSDESDNKKE